MTNNSQIVADANNGQIKYHLILIFIKYFAIYLDRLMKYIKNCIILSISNHLHLPY